jgi:hypothetical protein
VVIRSLLASEPGREVDRIRASEVPRRTYQEIRRRAFAEGWLQDALVPDAPYFGRPFVTFSLVRPYMDHLADLRRDWAEDPSVAHLWSSPETLFRVSFSARPPKAGGSFRQGFDLTVDARVPTVPVYFDFEGAWIRWTRQSTTGNYPQPLPGTGSRDRPSSSVVASERERSAAQWAVENRRRRPKLPLRVHGFGTLPRYARRAVESGRLEYRVFPVLARLPAFEDERIQRVALVHGQLKDGHRPEELFRALVGDLEVFPFLFVSDGRTVLMGALSADGVRDERRPVLETLQRHLSEIELTLEDIRTLSSVVAHRYEGVLSTPNPPGDGPSEVH